MGAETGSRPLRVLLVEDDEDDALIVRLLLEESGLDASVQRAATIAEALPMAADADCALLDMRLPDSVGLEGLAALREHADRLAVVVLTGQADERLGTEAVASGAQDYLVKGNVPGTVLARIIRYAVERRRAEIAERELALAELAAAENVRLERGLLPAPLLSTDRITMAADYRAGRRRALIGGDFYDVVETPDGHIHAIIGDVSGHGPDEAALGASLRIAWRTLVLSGAAGEAVLPILEDVLRSERYDRGVFTTAISLCFAPDGRSVLIRAAGHPPPLLLDGGETARFLEDDGGPPIGLTPGATWPGFEVELPRRWQLLLYTDGIIEGRIGDGAKRLGEAGLRRLVDEADVADPAAFLRGIVERAEDLNGGPLLDDVALLLLGPGGG